MTQQMDDCDELVYMYIPQYGRGTASLNVATAAAIVLHHFAEWAKYGNPQHRCRGAQISRRRVGSQEERGNAAHAARGTGTDAGG